MKPCPYCGAPMRSDNTRGACWECISNGKAPKVPAKPNSERLFRMACKALGLDWRAELGKLCTRWLKEHAR